MKSAISTMINEHPNLKKIQMSLILVLNSPVIQSGVVHGCMLLLFLL